MQKTIEEYTKEIKEFGNKNKQSYEQLEKLSSDLIKKSIEFIKEETKNKIENCVKNNPEQTKKLNSEDKLKELKDSMNKLLARISEDIIFDMSEDKVFIHRSYKLNSKVSSYEYGRIIRDRYIEVYQKLVGLAGEILNKFGYIKVSNDYNGHSEWQYISGSGGKIKYGYGFDSRLLDEAWKDYVVTYTKYYDDMLKYESLCAAKEQAEAVNLWESL